MTYLLQNAIICVLLLTIKKATTISPKKRKSFLISFNKDLNKDFAFNISLLSIPQHTF